MMLRLATPDDAGALLDIYSQYICTPITFEYALPTKEEFARRIVSTLERFPFLVWTEHGAAAGYAYAHPEREREAYQWNAELSIYLDASFTGLGAGKKLYSALISLLRLQGVKTVYGVVTNPNPPSEALHEALGFRMLGTHRNAGYKNGAWHDVTWFEKSIAPYHIDPQPIRPIHKISPQEIQDVLESFST